MNINQYVVTHGELEYVYEDKFLALLHAELVGGGVACVSMSLDAITMQSLVKERNDA